MHRDKFTHTTLELNKHGKFWKNLEIVHNIGDFVHAAFENWLPRTEEYTEKSLCDYIMSKDLMNIKAMPHSVYEKLLEEEE